MFLNEWRCSGVPLQEDRWHLFTVAGVRKEENRTRWDPRFLEALNEQNASARANPA